MTKVAEAENRASTTKGGSKPKTGSNPKVPKEAVATEQTIRKAQDAQSEGNKVASRGQGMIQEVCNSPDMGDWHRRAAPRPDRPRYRHERDGDLRVAVSLRGLAR